jgi:CubicO group peptidase (beta-lactamase class C family)
LRNPAGHFVPSGQGIGPRRKPFAAAAALLFLLSATGAGLGEESHSPQSIPELQAAIERVLKETKTPGVGLAVVGRDKAEWIAGLGKADVAANKPATAETLFRIGSTSKAFAAMAALQLEEAGKLKLTDTVRQWVPDVAFVNPWEATDPVRLEHLMEHTTGFDDIHLREYALNDPTPISLRDALAYGASSRVSRWRPGSRMSYCNSGPAVLAAVVEKVSGRRFEDYVQEHFFKPLHMDTASYFYTSEVRQRLATLYHKNGITPYPYWHIAYRPAGAINASAKDMANYVRFYLQRGSLDGAQLLRPSSIERMETTKTLPSAQLGKVAGYGLYNYATLEGRFVFRGHNGSVMGGLTEMAYLPDYGRGYVVMINSGNGEALKRITKLVRRYVIRDLKPPPLPPAVPVSAAVQRHYTGYYQAISPRTQIFYLIERLLGIKRLGFSSNDLFITSVLLRKDRWAAMSERLFRKEDQSAATLALLPDTDGQILIELNSATYKKVSALRVWGQPAAIVLISLIAASSPLFALVWGARKLFGKLPAAGPLSVRVLPLLSVIGLTAFWVFFAVAFFRHDLFALGTRSFLSVAIMVSSLAFAVATAASVLVVCRQRSAAMNRIAYFHSVLVTAAMAIVALYMGYWGFIGLRLWA